MNFLTFRSGFKNKLIFNKHIFLCQIGKNGLTMKNSKKEGDLKTPRGQWKIKRIFINPKFLKYFNLKKFLRNKLVIIKKNHIWCDDPKSHFYNKFIDKNKINFNFSHERLIRNDNVYNFFLEIDYNQNPIIKGKGSAIFIHASFDDRRSTKGCLAIDKNHLIFLINNLKRTNYLKII